MKNQIPASFFFLFHLKHIHHPTEPQRSPFTGTLLAVTVPVDTCRTAPLTCKPLVFHPISVRYEKRFQGFIIQAKPASSSPFLLL